MPSGEWFELPLPTAFGHGCLMSYQQCRHGSTDSGCLKQLGFCCPQDHPQSAVVSTRLVRVGFEGLFSVFPCRKYPSALSKTEHPSVDDGGKSTTNAQPTPARSCVTNSFICFNCKSTIIIQSPAAATTSPPSCCPLQKRP